MKKLNNDIWHSAATQSDEQKVKNQNSKVTIFKLAFNKQKFNFNSKLTSFFLLVTKDEARIVLEF